MSLSCKPVKDPLLTDYYCMTRLVIVLTRNPLFSCRLYVVLTGRVRNCQVYYLLANLAKIRKALRDALKCKEQSPRLSSQKIITNLIARWTRSQ